MNRKMYILGVVPLSLSIFLTGCGESSVETFDSAQTESSEETKPSVPDEIANSDYTGTSENVVWNEKKEIETTLSLDAYSLHFTEVGTVEYTDMVKPDEGVTLHALRFTKEDNEVFKSAERESDAYLEAKWDDKLTTNSVHLVDTAESGYLIVASKEKSKNVRLLAFSSPNGDPQEFSLETGENLTPEVGKAFYRDHAGFVGQTSDMKVKEKSKKVTITDGSIEDVSAWYSEKNGNKVNIVMDIGTPIIASSDTSVSDYSLDTDSREYVLIDNDGKEVKGKMEDKFSTQIEFPVNSIQKEYKMQAKLKGSVNNYATGADLGEDWSATYEWDVRMLSDY